MNFHDEKFILVATELAAESKAKKKFWHYFATGGQSNSVWNFFHLYCNSIRLRFQTILMMKDSKMYFLKVKSALKFRLNRSFWRGGIWKIGVDFHRGVVSPYLKPNLCYLSRVTFLVIRPPFVRAQLYIPMSRAAFDQQKLCHMNRVAKGQVFAETALSPFPDCPQESHSKAGLAAVVDIFQIFCH